MINFTRISLLLLFTCPVYSAPFIHCKPAGLFDVLKSDGLFCLLALIFLLVGVFSKVFDRKDLSWMACLVISGVLGGIVFFTAPDSLPVVDEEAIMSRPDIAKGRHYRNDCIQVDPAETTVTLSCKPGGRAVTVPKTDYDSAVQAFTQAQIQLGELKWQLRKNDICSTE